MTTPKKTRSELKREAILSAAKTAFQEEGVQNTSMDKLAALAQVSKRTVYNHFASKEQLVMELLTDLWRNSTSVDQLPALSQLPLQQQLTELLLQNIQVAGDPEYIDLAKVAFSYFLFKPGELKLQISRLTKHDTALHIWLCQQTEAGVLLISDIDEAMSQLHSLIKGKAFWPQITGFGDPLSEEESLKLAQTSAAMFLSHYQKHR